MPTCSSGKCHTGIYYKDGGHILLLLNGCLLLCPHRLRHMRPRSIGLIPSLPANTKLSKVEQNTHMAMQLRCRACPNIADNPPLPQPCKEVPHPCTMEAMYINILLLVFTQNFPTNIRYSGVQVALIHHPPTEHMGVLSVKCVTNYRKRGLWLCGESLSSHHISSTTEFNKVRTRETFRKNTSSKQSERD